MYHIKISQKIRQVLVNKMLRAYHDAIERSVDADERAKLNVRSQLEGLEVIAKNNTELQAKLDEANSVITELKSQLSK